MPSLRSQAAHARRGIAVIGRSLLGRADEVIEWCFLLRCMSPVVAQSGHPNCRDECPLSRVKRTSKSKSVTSAFDPTRTLASDFAVTHKRISLSTTW